jgi:hypothetical protein
MSNDFRLEDSVHTVSYTTDLGYVTLDMNSTLARQIMAGYRAPGDDEVTPPVRLLTTQPTRRPGPEGPVMASETYAMSPEIADNNIVRFVF